MIVFIYGTSAEAIKIAPLARRLNGMGIGYEQWLTMFHGESLLRSVNRLGFQNPDLIIPNGNDGQTVRSPWQTIKWLSASFWWIIKNKRSLRNHLGKDSLIIVHGDTLTTVMGTIFAKFLRLPSAHIEAGLRSGNWRHPFPEELDRRIAGRLATIHYVPSEEALSNLASKKNVIFTHGNTVIDAVLDVDTFGGSTNQKFGVCLLHRYEFLGNTELVRATLKLLSESTTIPIRVYLDDYSGSMLESLIEELASKKLIPQRKLPYDEFIKTLQEADFVFTDSGGIQAECSLLGLPTMIHRKATEQLEGVGENIILSNWDLDEVGKFLQDFEKLRKDKVIPSISPTQVIIDDLSTRGYLKEVC